MGKMFLLLVDAHSKWIDIHMSSSQSTIEKLRQSFATFSLLKVLVSDNGTSFTTQEFQDFIQQNGIVHKRGAPYHPACNGLVERAFQTFKIGIRKLTVTLEARLSRFLFNYRITPQSSTGVSPAELMFGCPLRSCFDLIYPDVSSRVHKKQEQQQNNRHAPVAPRCLEIWYRPEISLPSNPIGFLQQLNSEQDLSHTRCCYQTNNYFADM